MKVLNLLPASNNSLPVTMDHINTKLRVKFDGRCLKQEINDIYS